MSSIDPLSRLLTAIILAIGASVAHTLLGWAVVLSAIAFCFVLTGKGPSAYAAYIRPMLVFGALSIILGQGESGLRTAGRICALLAAVAWYGASVPPVRTAEALARLLAPLRRLGMPVDDLATGVFLAMRFLPLAVAEAGNLQLALEARGHALLPRRSAWRRVTGLAIPLLAGVLRRADTLAVTLVLRGYTRGRIWSDAGAGNARGRVSFADIAVVCVAVIALSVALFY